MRRLKPGDEELLRRFLSARAESSLFLLSNLRASGLGGGETAYHGDYYGQIDRAGALVAVLAHYWNGNVTVQAAEEADLSALADGFARVVSKPVAGVVGPDRMVAQVAAALGLTDAPLQIDSREGLHALDLARLSIPGSVQGTCVEAGAIDAALLRRWIGDYELETGLGSPDSAQAARLDARTAHLQREGHCWALMVDGEPVSLCGFNARLPDMVQLGPVWTPPEHRGRGHARTLVALCLAAARERGVARAILFTRNPAAEAVYRALGFRRIGMYRLMLFAAPVPVGPPA